MKTTIALISLSALLACQTLTPQESPRPAAGGSLADRFKQLDKNGDGKLAAEEVQYGDFFKQWDQNSDGVVTLEEVQAFFASGRQRQRGPARNPAALQTGGVPMKTVLDLPYAKIEGVEPKLTSLDIYAPPSATNAPILVWVHGGGWARGDKAQVAGLPAAFVREGFVVASVNYRLAPAVKFDAQAQDVAAAIAWMRKHARDYGAAPEKMFLMGHSAGAHLVALVGTDESYLKAHGLSLAALRGVVPLDTEAYDLKGFAARFGGKLPELYAAPFTQDPATWAKASPATHVAGSKGIPPMIVAYSGGQKPHGNPSRKTDAEGFAAKLKAAGVRAEVVAAPEKTHGQIALEFGAPDDQVATKVFAFLKTILGVRAAPPSSADFTPDDVRMSDTQFATIDPEFLQSEGLAVFLDSSLAIWVGEIDPATGLFRNASGRDHRLDTGISQWSRYSNGPEWGLDAQGPALFYVKDNAQGAGQLWRAEPPWDKPRLAQLTRDTDIHNWICEPSVNPALASTRVIVFRGNPRASGNADAWLDEDKPDKPKPFTDRMIVARWAYHTSFIAFAYRARPGQTEPSQVTLVDTDTGKSRVITADEGNKIDPWLWQAPEFGGELLLGVNVDGRALALYRDVKRDGTPWQRIATLAWPADAPYQRLKSVEPVNGGRGAFGKSYFTVQAGDDKDTDTSIWLFGFSADGDHLIRRLDDGARTGKPARRLDPESYIGERELFVYYTLVGDGPSQLHRCRAGVNRAPAATMAAPQNDSGAPPLARLAFRQDYFPGTRDASGRFMGGTEAMWLAGHDGKLFAAIGYGQDQPGADPKPGAQVLRKDAPDAPWQVDHQFEANGMRVEGLISFAFTTDRNGMPLPKPARLLVASPSELAPTGGTSAVIIRDDATGQWRRSEIAGGHLGVRAFGSHVDKVAGVHHLFAGLNRGGIHRGSFDPAAPAGIRWEATPERTAEAQTGKGRRIYDYSRVLGFAECNGDLYMAARITTDEAGQAVDGGLYRRTDGPKPEWKLVHRWAIDKDVLQSRFLRGLTAVPDPQGGQHQVLIANFEYPGLIARFDPTRAAVAAEQELDIKAFFNKAWNTPSARRRGAIAAYNRFLPVTDPKSGEPLWLCGAWVERTGSPYPPDNGSCYLIRHRDGRYDWGAIYDAAHPVPAGQKLTGCRDIEPSPFPGEQGRVFYFCGYDGGSGPSHNTAWIYRGEWEGIR